VECFSKDIYKFPKIMREKFAFFFAFPPLFLCAQEKKYIPHHTATTFSNNRFHFLRIALQQQTEPQLFFGCCQQQAERLAVAEAATRDIFWL
jgi:hypothetical protein